MGVGEETNHYKRALVAAKTAVVSARDGLTEDAPLPSGVGNTLLSGAWYCSEADTWFEDLNRQCDRVPVAFDAAIDEIEAALGVEPDDVDANDWRGTAYLTRHIHRAGMVPL
jgi:hypothetical protein